MSDARPIGVFDSGLGGLTVLRALKQTLPHESTIYLGDTARVPYGTRSADTVIKYARNNARTLAETADLKALVIACNTVSAVALEPLQQALDIPVIGVIAPGARAALKAAPDGSLLILGTAGTVRSGAYERALAEAGYAGKTEARACPLFVPLVEEGWTDGEVPQQVARRYLGDLDDDVAAVILGCTHYPHLRPTLEQVLKGPTIVDGGEATAEELKGLLHERELLAPEGTMVSHRVLVTDAPEQMEALGPRFGGGPLGCDEVELVNVIVTE
jgi:glutamate racemase